MKTKKNEKMSLEQKIVEEYGDLAAEILARIYCGESVDSAIQNTLCD